MQLALVLVLVLVLSPIDVASEDALAIYIRTPSAGAAAAALGEPWLVEVSIYATIDTPTSVEVVVTIDDRLTLVSRAAVSQVGGPVSCIGAGDLTCTLRVQRWAEGYVLLAVRAPEGVWPCGPLVLTATATAPGRAPVSITRARPLVDAERCVSLPFIGGMP